MYYSSIQVLVVRLLPYWSRGLWWLMEQWEPWSRVINSKKKTSGVSASNSDIIYQRQHQCVTFLLGLPTQFFSLANQGESLQIFYMILLAVVVLIPQPSHAGEEGSGEDVQNFVCSVTMILVLFPMGGASGKLHVPEYTKVQKLYSNFTWVSYLQSTSVKIHRLCNVWTDPKLILLGTKECYMIPEFCLKFWIAIALTSSHPAFSPKDSTANSNRQTTYIACLLACLPACCPSVYSS